MKILNAHQISEADRFTIANEPISSLDLMERAGQRIFEKIILCKGDTDSFIVFCGPGNNGGDGLVIARMLKLAKKNVNVIILNGNFTKEFKANLEKLKRLGIRVSTIDHTAQLDELEFDSKACMVDALFGAGISGPLEGLAAQLVQKINSCHNYKFAIDVPSGLSPDSSFTSTMENTVQANHTFSIQLPKLAFMFAENSRFASDFECVDIGLSGSFIHSQDTPYLFSDEFDISKMVKPRMKFGHKGTFGHALIVAGSSGKIGASILSASAALKAGCGLLTTLIPENAVLPMHCSLPEAMVIPRYNDHERMDYSAFSAIGFGPGVGTSVETSELLYELLNLYHRPLVIDADGLNCLAYNPTWYRMLKSNIILTPHPGEFDRLTHLHATGFERCRSQFHFSKKHNVTIVLKGHYTSITTPSGLTFFNPTGNNGMATAGSGDVLAGIITSLCARGYKVDEAAILGVYLHGYAGDVAAKKKSRTSMVASDIVEGIGVFFRNFEK